MLYNKNWQKLSTWQEVLLRAADLIEEDGWCRDAYQRGNRHCMAGAILAVTITTTDELIRRAVVNLSVHLGMPFVMYNDNKARSGKEVVAAMRAAASK